MKKLYRSRQNRVIGGVCSGLAKYLDVDTAVIRILFLISACIGGVGIIAYFVLCLVIPDEPIRYVPNMEDAQYSEVKEEKETGASDCDETEAKTFASDKYERRDSYGESTKDLKKKFTDGAKWGVAVWGLILIFVGFLFLGRSFGWFPFCFWSSFRHLWPFILVFLGVNILPVRSWIKGVLNILLLIVLFTLVFINGTICHRSEKGFKKSDFYGISEFRTEQALFEMDVKQEDSMAYVEIDAGACVCLGFSPCAGLADIKTNDKNKESFLKEIDQNLNKAKFKVQSRTVSKVELGLNENPIWHMEINAGVGEIDLDLSKYKVKQINVEGGVSSFALKVGALYPQTNLHLESGLASFEISAPKEVGVCVESSLVLGSSDLEGLKKIDGAFYSDNFKTASSKLYIQVEGALSSFTFKRY